MYSVGTICIGQKFLINTEKNGQECKVIEPYQYRCLPAMESSTGTIIPPGYRIKVRWKDGEETWVRKENLRPKHYPGSWEELRDIWNPIKEEV